MLTFISCAKTMASRCSLKVPEVTVPHFETEAVCLLYTSDAADE